MGKEFSINRKTCCTYPKVGFDLPLSELVNWLKTVLRRWLLTMRAFRRYYLFPDVVRPAGF